MGFSIAFDGGNKSNQSYVDIRICFCIETQLCKSASHCPTIPRASHWIEHVQRDKEVLGCFMRSMDEKLIGISTDGALNMTGRYQGVVTYLCNDTPHLVVVHRVWCGAHQLDLVAQSATRKVLDG
jgi:hypothetical protein